MMKICIVTPYVMKGDGQGRANYEVVWEAIRRGYELTLVAVKISPELETHPQIKWIKFPNTNFPTALLNEMIFSGRSAGWLRQHRHEFDLVQVYGAVTSAVGDINTSQFVHTAWRKSPVHTSRIHRSLYGVYHWLYSALNAAWEKTAFRKAKISIAVSDKIKQELIHELGLVGDRIHVIHNGVDVEEFVPGVESREQFGLPTDVSLGMFAGDIRTNRKNLDTVLRSLVQVPDLHLAVVGTTEGSPYPAMAAELGISDRVHFLGFRRDIAKIMQAVDFFVFPSRYEACTLVLLEAMASGLPVITATSAGGAELVTPESGFVLQNSDDADALAKAMETLSRDRTLGQTMGQAARQVAEQNTWTAKAKNYVDLFEELVNNENLRNYTDVSPSQRSSAVLGSAN
uniref:glycosyltransferase family 4 protein n=2 Tax=Calothrix sp. PCC 6303 TaxID=1170562 RepID=UPI0002DB5401|nr:glycosyltransferase family 4 protein [Calothrix sp. PCC 6303]